MTAQLDISKSFHWSMPTLTWLRDHIQTDDGTWSIQDINMEEHLSMESWVALLHHIEARHGDLHSLGMLTAAHIVSTYRFSTLLRALHYLHILFSQSDECCTGKGYRVGAANDNMIMVSSKTAYPDAFEYGVIYGLVYAYRQAGQQVRVDQFHAMSRQTDNLTRTYAIHFF